MKRRLLLAVVSAMMCLLTCSCNKSSGLTGKPRGEALGWGSKRGLTLPDTLGQGKKANTRHAWVSALAFPEGYDWRRDTAYGAVSGSLRLYRDSLLQLEMPAGPGLDASMSSDRHTMYGGHFYAWTCREGITNIRKDGNLYATLPGEENLLGLIDMDGELWTLGRSRDGLKLCLNGEIKWSAPDGDVQGDLLHRDFLPGGALYVDNGQICFTLSRTVSGIPAGYLVTNGNELQVSVQEDILDMTRHAGLIKKLVRRASDGEIVLCEGNDAKDITDGGNFRWISAHFMRSLMTGDNDDGNTVIWGTGRKGGDNTIVTAVWISGWMGEVAWGSQDVYACTDSWPPYVFIGQSIKGSYMPGQTCIDTYGGHIWMAASPLDSTTGRKPALYKDAEKIIEYDLNGYLTGVWIQPDPG